MHSTIANPDTPSAEWVKLHGHMSSHPGKIDVSDWLYPCHGDVPLQPRFIAPESYEAPIFPELSTT